MKQPSKDPFEVAFDLEENYDEEEEEPPPPPPPPPSSQSSSQQQLNPQNQQQQQQVEEEEEDEQEEVSPSESPIRADEIVTETQTNSSSINIDDEFNTNNPQSSTTLNNNNNTTTTTTTTNNKKRKLLAGQASTSGKNKDDDDDEEEENMEVELGKFTSSGDPDKMAKMQAILSQLTEEQMSRYESFRRSGFQKANMKKLLASITGSPKISVPMTIVVSGIAKMFVGELVETGRVIMTERGETGPIRPCHIREAYRRLKLEGKVPKKSVPRLFR